jgi:hypothetical protein
LTKKVPETNGKDIDEVMWNFPDFFGESKDFFIYSSNSNITI